MKRVTLLGCFIAALALSSVFAGAAQAKKVETGPMRLRSLGGASHLGSSQGTIESTSNKGHGLYENETSGTADSAFFNVEATALHAKCQSGAEPGTVRTKKLVERNVWINKAGGEAGVVFEAGEPPFLAEFECGGIGVKVEGSVIGRISPLNTMAGNSKLNLEGSGFHNEPATDETDGATKHVLESEFSVAPGTKFESIQAQPNVEVKVLKKGAPCKKEETAKEKCKEGKGEINGSGLTNVAKLPALGRCGVAKKSLGNYTNESCTVKAGTEHTGGFEWTPAT